MNTRIYYALYFISIFAIVIGIWFLVTAEEKQTDIAIPVVLAYSENQQNRSSAVYIGDGYFFTASHVLGEDQKQVVLETNLEQRLVADVLWTAKEYDISLLYTEHHESVEIDSYSIDCAPLEIGDELRFIGNPSNAEFITTWGRVSSFETSIDGMWRRIIPVNASIVPGMSGGAAVDDNNSLRGINVGTLRAMVGMTPMGPDASFTGISYIVEAADICFLMGKT